ncbi:acidic fibroblast growth factor intracellular-binding protein-like [Mizuhopecten yessoensis]|uniref:Acidic fibroblast growth factor intracellular-binding protein n=1 Tax=Mizuhopecten yessoensis TaxID=6573 RepID=A0A210QCX2_MIZYE|nr:acidic fibroblast growth factor intracellular-binding protein-like [Mizuhopecten yessoensis]XP_021361384.1 acidic fibroblast growth factor intracellular-binding protein-like [Mizuhopecten yessoensis]XP_021361385.1 acidic fibroblast growth factor intracellular-binding protein-like [Mizuhopecten yessoensis]OWF46584.1 Acidic fibroblast growth factor intracellular-binding protein [Mizuhopecten yessoensis]
MAMVDVFVGNFTVIDTDLYELWLSGYSAHDASAVLQKRGVLHNMGVGFQDLVSDTQDNYRLFINLEKLLKDPAKLGEQHLYQLDPQTQKLLIERYYQFDAVVVREVLGKKLSSRNRKDLDDVCEKTRVPLRSCRRQFDNLKRVFKTVEDLTGTLVENIQAHYLVSEVLAKEYAAIVFIANNRFETGKKKLSHLTFYDFVHCATSLIANWSYTAKDSKGREDMDVDLDRRFLQDLREFKILLDKENLDEHKSLVLNATKTALPKRIHQDLDDNFKNMSKAIVNIAYGLNHSKEARDIFIDLVEKIIEPCMQGRWLKDELNTVLLAYRDVYPQLEAFRHRNLSRHKVVWDRYMNTLTSCIVQLYHS